MIGFIGFKISFVFICVHLCSLVFHWCSLVFHWCALVFHWGQVENSDVSDISDFLDQIVRVFQVRVFLLALCSNLKTRTSRTKLSDFFFFRTIEFLLCSRRKLGHVGTRQRGLLGRKGQTFPCVQIVVFLHEFLQIIDFLNEFLLNIDFFINFGTLANYKKFLGCLNSEGSS